MVLTTYWSIYKFIWHWIIQYGGNGCWGTINTFACIFYIGVGSLVSSVWLYIIAASHLKPCKLHLCCTSPSISKILRASVEVISIYGEVTDIEWIRCICACVLIAGPGPIYSPISSTWKGHFCNRHVLVCATRCYLHQSANIYIILIWIHHQAIGLSKAGSFSCESIFGAWICLIIPQH